MAAVLQQDLAGRFKRRSLSDAMTGIAKPGALSRQHPIAPIDGQDLHVSPVSAALRGHIFSASNAPLKESSSLVYFGPPKSR